jgi:outer membrane protein TolC
MSRRLQQAWAFGTSLLIALTGCHPTKPFYFFEDGDLAHYVDKATKIDYPDAQTTMLADIENSAPPLTMENATPDKFWDIKLEECVKFALDNSKVMRSLGGRYSESAFQSRAQTGEAPDAITTAPDNSRSVYDPALIETTPFVGTEYALSAFDATLASSMFWQHNDRPQNVRVNTVASAVFAPVFEENNGTFQATLSKNNAWGGTWSLQNNVVYDQTNNPTWAIPSTYNVNYQATFNQPLLQGAGVLYNRIAGPYNPFISSTSGLNTPAFDGVMLARINVDISLADFEGGVRNLVYDVENAYWELYFAYRSLEASKAGRDSALLTWKKINSLYQVGAKGGEAEKEAQSRAQYFLFRAQVQTALNDLFRAENRLRYVVGLGVADGRLMRPADEPTTAEVAFDWHDIHSEALGRSPELRRQKWRIKERELEIIAAKNNFQPRLDASGTYRWLGLGDTLINPNAQNIPLIPGTDVTQLQGSNAYQSLTSGKYQEWQLGLQFQMTLGFRAALSTLRHYQLQLAKEKARLQDEQLEVSMQMGEAVRNLEYNYQLSLSNFNRRVAAEKQVEAVRVAFEAETVTLDLLLDAQRQRADAELAYFRSLVDYQRGIAGVHYRKGSLLEYDGVYLSEGPWPAKAQWDAHRLARQRDASHYLDYGFTRPKVISRGEYLQHGGKKSRNEDGSVKPSTTIPQTEAEPLMTPEPVSDPAAVNEGSSQASSSQGQNRAGKAGFDWGGLGLDADGQQPKTAASGGSQSPKIALSAGGDQDRPSGATLKIVRANRGWSNSSSRTSAADEGVRTAVYQESDPSATNETAEDQPASATDRPVTGWQAKKR